MSNSSPLFRPEVTAALGSQWMGSIRLAQPLSATLIAIVALIIAAVLIAYITFGSITKKARVTGITVPVGGQLSVAAPNAGILLTTHVKEGEQVKAGQILFTLSTERQNSQGEITPWWPSSSPAAPTAWPQNKGCVKASTRKKNRPCNKDWPTSHKNIPSLSKSWYWPSAASNWRSKA